MSGSALVESGGGSFHLAHIHSDGAVTVEPAPPMSGETRQALQMKNEGLPAELATEFNALLAGTGFGFRLSLPEVPEEPDLPEELRERIAASLADPSTRVRSGRPNRGPKA